MVAEEEIPAGRTFDHPPVRPCAGDVGASAEGGELCAV